MKKSLKLQIDELIDEGKSVKSKNYKIPPPGVIMLPYIAGNGYDNWMNKVKIFTSRNLKEYPLYEEIIKTYDSRNHQWGTTAYDNMMSYLETLVSDEEFLLSSDISNIHDNINMGVGEEKMKSVFLSHSSKDKFFVRELAERLKNNGVKVWLDEAEINIGDSLTEKIGKAIDDTDFVCAVLSHNSINSSWVQKELQVALHKEFSGKSVVVLPILLESVEIPAFLRDKLYADFSTPDNYNNNFPKLLKALGVDTVNAQKEIIKKQPVNEIDKFILDSKNKSEAAITQYESKLINFVDIKIIGFDEKRSYNPDLNKVLYNIYLELSTTPSSEWEQIFEAERRFPRHSMWRKAWIEGKYIVIHCVPSELEKYHLNDLKEDTKNTNAKFRRYLKELADQELRELKKKNIEEQNMSDIKSKLNFD